jgi:23S rRNA-/tRNA-specific pseudouridylate synthase
MIFDNKNITVLNKPPNFSVQGGDNIDRNLFSLMAARYKR